MERSVTCNLFCKMSGGEGRWEQQFIRYKLWKCQNNQWNTIIIKVSFTVGELPNLFATSSSDFILKGIDYYIYNTSKICQIDMPTPKKTKIFTSPLLTFPLNPPGWLPVIWLSALFPAFWNLLRITRWLGACKLHLTDFLASCFLLRFCQWEALPGNWKAGVDFFSCFWWQREASASGPGQCRLRVPAQAVQSHSSGRDVLGNRVLMGCGSIQQQQLKPPWQETVGSWAPAAWVGVWALSCLQRVVIVATAEEQQ